MDVDTISVVALTAVAALMIGGIVLLVLKRGAIGNFASLSVYHDLQPRDKQEAIENVIELKAGKKRESDQESDKDVKNRVEYELQQIHN